MKITAITRRHETIRPPVVLGALILALAATGCKSGTRDIGPARTTDVVARERANPADETMGWWSAYREGDGVTFAVNVAAARRRPDPPFVPLLVAVGNAKLEKLTITRESITLVDEEGHLYPLATAKEVLGLRAEVAADERRVFDPVVLRTITRQFASYRAVSAVGRLQPDFGTHSPLGPDADRADPGTAPTGPAEHAKELAAPAPGSADRDVPGFDLPPKFWTIDLLYFVRPPGALAGRDLRVRLKTREMAAPLVFPFRVH